MSVPAYESYRESEVQWLGLVPSHWRRVPFWSLFRRVKRVGYPNAELLSVYRDYGVIRKSDRSDNFNNPSEDLGAYQLVRIGDLAVNKMKAWQGSLGVSRFEGIVSPAYFVYSPTHSNVDSFLHYLLRSDEFSAAFMTISKGIRVNQWDVDPQYLGQLGVFLPPPPEQAAIATFLDWETAKIDALVEEQRRLIDLLKEKRQAVISHAVTKGLDPSVPMKDSGVEWLGEVPAHWEVSRLKFVADIQSGVAKGKDFGAQPVQTVPYLRVANVQDGRIDLTDLATLDLPPSEIGKYLLRPGDVLMNEGGDFDKLGRGGIWRGEFSPCIHQNHVFSVRPKLVSPEWLSFVTSSNAAQFFFMGRSKQSTNLASISSSNLMELPLCVPSATEQEALSAEISHRTEGLSLLVDEAQAAIGLLQERRSALISAAVTGKIDVRGLVSSEAEAA